MKRFVFGSLTVLTIAILALAMSATSARANTLTPNLVSVTGGANSTFNYNVMLSPSGELDTLHSTVTEFVTINDIAGYVSCSAPAGWSCSSALIGSTGYLTSPPDNGSIPNVTFTWTGTGDITGPVTYTGFSIVSKDPNTTLGYWSDTDVKNDPGQTDDETTQGSVGSVNVPAPAPVPEPSSLVMLGSGLIGLIGLRRKLAA